MVWAWKPVQYLELMHRIKLLTETHISQTSHPMLSFTNHAKSIGNPKAHEVYGEVWGTKGTPLNHSWIRNAPLIQNNRCNLFIGAVLGKKYNRFMLFLSKIQYFPWISWLVVYLWLIPRVLNRFWVLASLHFRELCLCDILPETIPHRFESLSFFKKLSFS